jgi:hypothetical protein
MERETSFSPVPAAALPPTAARGKVRCIDRPHTMKKGRETSIEWDVVRVLKNIVEVYVAKKKGPGRG